MDALSEVSCTTRPGECVYITAPVKVVDTPVELPRRPYKFFPLAEPLNFTDARAKTWVAPRGTLTDGASIPPIFVSIVGSPTAPEYVEAGAIHDAYCGVGNEGGANYHRGRWQDVHRMFYDALVASGTPDQRAKLMFAAVWLGGPRWNTYEDLTRMPIGTKQAGLRKVQRYIEQVNPSLRQLERKLMRVQAQMMRQHPDLYPMFAPGDGKAESDFGYHEEPQEEYDEYEDYGEDYGGDYDPYDETGDLQGDTTAEDVAVSDLKTGRL